MSVPDGWGKNLPEVVETGEGDGVMNGGGGGVMSDRNGGVVIGVLHWCAALVCCS